MPSSCTFFPFSVATICKFGLCKVSQGILYVLFVLSCFSLLLSEYSSSSTLFSSPDILLSTWPSLLVEFSTEFLTYWAFNFQDFNSTFFFRFLCLYRIPFSCLILFSLFHSAVFCCCCIHLEFMKVFICILLNSFRYLFLSSLVSLTIFEFCVWDFIHFTIIIVHYSEIVDFGESHVALFFIFLVFCVMKCTFVTRTLVGGFNHL
jgi:hypothetical protein